MTPGLLLSELARRTDLMLPASPAYDPSITQISADSRQVAPGTLFVAVPGLRVDGHNYIPIAVRAGAVAVVGTLPRHSLESQGIALPVDIPYFTVTDARAALAQLAAALHGFPSHALTVVGVTGTDGKTTTCTLLEAIFAQAASVGVITTIGARIGGEEQDTGFHVTTPEAPDVQRYLAQMRDAGCQYAVVESTSHGLDQKRVAEVAYDVAAVTNITHEHLDYHGSYEAYRAAKALLFRSLFHSPSKPGVPRVAVLNADDEGSYAALKDVLQEEASRGHAPVVQTRSYSLVDASADVHTTDIDYQTDATRFILHWWGGTFAIETRLIGEFNVANVLCAATVALALGIEPAQVQQGITSVPGVLGRMQRMNSGEEFLAVVDFAHSPVSLERALHTLRPLVGPGGRLIAIFGSAGLRDRAKRRLMGRVSGRLADYTIITAEDPRTEDLAAINREIAAGVEEHAPATAYRIVPDRTEAIWQGIQMAQPGDVVASFGKGHERSMCFGEIEYPWSDQEAMLSALQRRRKSASSPSFIS